MMSATLHAAELDESTVAAILSSARSTESVDDTRPLSEQAELRLRGRGQATHVVLDHTAYVQLAQGEGDTTQAEGFVVPDQRRRGIGLNLVRDVIATLHGTVLVWSHGDHPAARRLADRFGAERARELWMMSRSSGRVAEAIPPEGITIRAFQPSAPGRAGDEAEWLTVNAAAFADHPEQGGWTQEDLSARMGEPWFDPDGFFVAEDDEGIVGFHWTKIADGVGEVYVVGVGPRAQGRGLGRVLTGVGLKHLLDSGVERIELYVEADNDAAVGLYRSLGFEVATVDVQYRWTPPGSSTSGTSSVH